MTGPRAFSGGAVSADQVEYWEATEMQVTNSSAVAAGGALLFSNTLEIIARSMSAHNSVVTAGDGGALWFAQLDRVEVTNSTFIDCAAAAGAGAVMFVQGDSFVTPFRIDQAEFGNSFIRTQPDAPASLYGPIQASDAVALRAPLDSLTIYPGQDFDAEENPVRVLISAIDAYGQVMITSRVLIVQVDLRHFDGRPGPDALLSGTPLQRISADQRGAVFEQLRIEARPDDYRLLFTLLGNSGVATQITLRVMSECPAGQHYEEKSRSCVTCLLDFLVYNQTAQTCLPCPAGQQVIRASSNSTSADADGAQTLPGGAVSCQVCPLGSMSASGSACASCGLNAYQPLPGAPCQPCIDIDGLQCDGSGLAQVQPGYFAFSLWDESAGGPRIRTHPCPDGFCSGGFVQQARADEGSSNETDSSSSVMLRSDGSADSSSGSAFPSSITRFDQCAFPRLAAETNLLCGECVEGFIPWGDKCVRCDRADGGMLALLLLLSLLLVAFLLRAALGSSSAGHSVVLLYFVQTAMLEIGGATKLLGWLNIALFSPNSTGECIAPLSPYQQTQVQIVMPLFLFTELMLVAGLHYLAFRRWAAQAQAEGRRAAAHAAAKGISLAGLSARLRSSALRFVGAFSPDLYVSASLSLLLFTYTQVAAACLSYLSCADVAGVSVVFSQPSMRCSSPDYRRTLVLVVIALAVYVAGFPIAVLLFLWRRSDLVRESHRLIGTRAQAKVVAAAAAADSLTESGGVDVGSLADPDAHSSDSAASSSSPSSSPSAGAVAHFLRRYSPLFSMYAPSAWFWQVFVLVRRTVFAVVSVLLVRSSNERNLSFSLAHLASLLVQLHFRPFQSAFFNAAEAAFHALLIVISMALTAYAPPLSHGTEIVLFLLIVPPVAVYALAAGVNQFLRRPSARAASLTAKSPADQLRAAKPLPHSALTDVSVELNQLDAILPHPSPSDSPSHPQPSDGAVALEPVQAGTGESEEL